MGNEVLEELLTALLDSMDELVVESKKQTVLLEEILIQAKYIEGNTDDLKG